MALLPAESWSRGFVVDATGIVVTYSLAGAKMWAGFLRDPDGRLVIVDG